MVDRIYENLLHSYSPEFLIEFWTKVLTGLLLFFMLERLLPARTPNLRGFLTSANASAIFLLITPLAISIPNYFIGEWLALIQQNPNWPFRINIREIADKAKNWAWLIMWLPVSAFIFDFFYYWFHRLQHNSLLWHQHKLHHSDEHFSAATAFRHHWLEEVLRAFLIALPMGLVFNLTHAEEILIGTVVFYWGIFIHANVRISFGPLTPLIVGPQLHRIHHSLEPPHLNRNFAAFFPLWDILFGTYYKPKPQEYPATGVMGERSELDMRDILFQPFHSWFGKSRSRVGKA